MTADTLKNLAANREEHVRGALRDAGFSAEEAQTFIYAVCHACSAFAMLTPPCGLAAKAELTRNLERGGLLTRFGGELVLSERGIALARNLMKMRSADYRGDHLATRVDETLLHLRILIDADDDNPTETTIAALIHVNSECWDEAMSAELDALLIHGRAVFGGGAGAETLIAIA